MRVTSYCFFIFYVFVFVTLIGGGGGGGVSTREAACLYQFLVVAFLDTLPHPLSICICMCAGHLQCCKIQKKDCIHSSWHSSCCFSCNRLFLLGVGAGGRIVFETKVFHCHQVKLRSNNKTTYFSSQELFLSSKVLFLMFFFLSC